MEEIYFSLILIFIHGKILSLQSGRQVFQMTMFSPNGGFGYENSHAQANCIGADFVICQEPLIMAEDESRTESLNGVSESTQEEKDEGWLQLGIGGTTTTQDEVNDRRNGASLVELELLPGSSSNSISPLVPVHEFQPPRQFASFPTPDAGFSPLMSFLHQQADPRNSSTPNFQRQQEINNWAFRAVVPFNTTTASFSYPSSTSVAPGSYYSGPPFEIYGGMDLRPATVVQRPVLDFRVIPTPRRPHSGIWFMLQASKNQEREVSLPQISKSYLRIKDGRMTVRLVMKYLVNKLSNESEIEIRCRGERLDPLLTLQHVRDNIWSRDTYVTLLPNSSTIDHIMVLHYARTTTAASN